MCSSPLSGGRGLLSPPEGLEGSWGTMLNPNPRLQALLPCEVLGVSPSCSAVTGGDSCGVRAGFGSVLKVPSTQHALGQC